MNNTAIEGNRQPEGWGDVTDLVGCHVIGVFVGTLRQAHNRLLAKRQRQIRLGEGKCGLG